MGSEEELARLETQKEGEFLLPADTTLGTG